MSSRHCLGSLSSLPYPSPSLFLEIEGPPPESQTQQQQPPQQVVIDEAAPDNLDNTFEYFIEGEEPEVVSNAVVLVDPCT